VPVQVQVQDRGKGGRSGSNIKAGGRHDQGGDRGGSRRGRIIDGLAPVVRFCRVAGNITPFLTLVRPQTRSYISVVRLNRLTIRYLSYVYYSPSTSSRA